MDIHEVYQKDSKFSGSDTEYYILVGEGGSASLSKNRKYYIITCPAVAIYDIDAGSIVKKVRILTWPISCEEYAEQEEQDEYFERFQNGEIYKVVGRLRYNSAGEVAFLYIKEVLEEQVSGTKLDKKRETYMAPIHLEDEILVNHMKYLFVNQDGSYTIGYEDGYVFGGHEIDVDVDAKGKMIGADMR